MLLNLFLVFSFNLLHMKQYPCVTARTECASWLQPLILFVSTKVAEMRIATMNIEQKQRKPVVSRKPFIGALLIGLFLFILAMANFESLHRLVHTEAKNADHQCAVTLLASGQVDASPATEILDATTLNISSTFALPEIFVLPAADYSLLPGRAPPTFL